MRHNAKTASSHRQKSCANSVQAAPPDFKNSIFPTDAAATTSLLTDAVGSELFPLNRRWRFAADVVSDAVDTAYFVDDPA